MFLIGSVLLDVLESLLVFTGMESAHLMASTEELCLLEEGFIGIHTKTACSY